MSLKYFAVLLASFFILNNTHAQENKKTAASGKSYATLVSATMQRRIPGMKGAQPIVSYSFILKWKSRQAPETFFWRGSNGWMNCGVKGYKAAKKGKKGEEVAADKITRGDCIELTPMPGGKFPMPEEIQNMNGQNIFFKTATSGWRYLPVTNITKKKDLLMP